MKEMGNRITELLQLNRTQFSSLGIFVNKKLEIEKTKKTTFITSVLKVVYWVVLVFSISNFFIQERKLSAKKSTYLQYFSFRILKHVLGR